MRVTKNFPSKGKPKYVLLVDGDCESWYFEMLKRNNRFLPVDLKPEIPQRKKLLDQYRKVLEYSNHYDQVIWVVDLDVINAETRKTAKGKNTALQNFDKYVANLNTYENVTVIINSPCLEFWFLLHFESTTAPFSNCEQAVNRLKRYLKDYDKTKHYFTRQNDDIYLKLKPRILTAIRNAETVSHNVQGRDAGFSEMYKLFKLDKIKLLFKD